MGERPSAAAAAYYCAALGTMADIPDADAWAATEVAARRGLCDRMCAVGRDIRCCSQFVRVSERHWGMGCAGAIGVC